MSFEELKAAILLMAEDMEHKPDDAHEIRFKLHELLDQMRATGMPMPDDLVELERRLESDFENPAG